MNAVSDRALLARVNRKLLKQDGQLVRVCREDSRWFNELGRYYVVDVKLNEVINKHVYLEALAGELGVQYVRH